MAFKTFVQVGRAVIITKGPELGKLGVISIFPQSPTLPLILKMRLLIPFVVEIISEKSVLNPRSSMFQGIQANYMLGIDWWSQGWCIPSSHPSHPPRSPPHRPSQIPPRRTIRDSSQEVDCSGGRVEIWGYTSLEENGGTRKEEWTIRFREICGCTFEEAGIIINYWIFRGLWELTLWFSEDLKLRRLLERVAGHNLVWEDSVVHASSDIVIDSEINHPLLAKLEILSNCKRRLFWSEIAILNPWSNKNERVQH